MPDATATALTVELYRVQGGVAAPLQVRCAGETPDATDIEALIAAAIAAHNSDPAAHPDLRKAIEDAAGSGGTLVTTPVLTLAERLPIGAAATLGMTARAGLNGAHVARFEVTVGDAASVEVSATDDAATYTFTPAGNAGDTLTVGVVAVDNYGNRSPEATAETALYTPGVIAVGANAQQLAVSKDQGLTWESRTTPYTIINVSPGGIVLGVDASGNVYRSVDLGASWGSSPVVTVPSYKGCAVSKSGTIFLFTYTGRAGNYKSVDYGETWTAYDLSNIQSTIEGCGYGLNGTMYIYGGGSTSYVAISTDEGNTWKSISKSSGSIRGISIGRDINNDNDDVIVVITVNGSTRYSSGVSKTLINTGWITEAKTHTIFIDKEGNAQLRVTTVDSSFTSRYYSLPLSSDTWVSSTGTAQCCYTRAGNIMFHCDGGSFVDGEGAITPEIKPSFRFTRVYAFPDLA